jgi:hypothetical protein
MFSVYEVERGPKGQFRAMRKVEVEETKKPKRRAYLEHWSLIQRSPYTKWVHLEGNVYGHPTFNNGDFITTSPILKLDIPGGYAETMNTKYMLKDDRED